MTARIADRNGWFEIKANPLSRVGVFDYSGAMIGSPADPNKIYQVYRPEEELSSPETLDSFRLLPFINNHTMLGKATPNAIPAEQKGVHGVIGDGVFYDPTDRMIKGNIKIFSDTQQKTIDSGKVDLSLGYLCKYDPTPGVFEGKQFQFVQRSIYGNHVANVNAGRMGDAVSVMDSLSVTFDAKDVIVMAKNEKWLAAMRKRIAAGSALRVALGKKERIAVDAKLVAAMDAADDEVAAAGEPTLEDVSELLKDVLPKITDINEAMASAAMPDMDDDMEPEMDAAGQPVMDADGKPKMKKKVAPVVAPTVPAAPVVDKKDAMVMDKAAMDAAIELAVKPFKDEIAKLKADGVKNTLSEIAQRDKLAHQLSNHIGTFDYAEMTLAQVAKYGVTKLSIPAMDGQEVSSVTAWLHGRSIPKPTFGIGLDHSDPNKKSSVSDFIAGKAA